MPSAHQRPATAKPQTPHINAKHAAPGALILPLDDQEVLVSARRSGCALERFASFASLQFRSSWSAPTNRYWQTCKASAIVCEGVIDHHTARWRSRASVFVTRDWHSSRSCRDGTCRTARASSGVAGYRRRAARLDQRVLGVHEPSRFHRRVLDAPRRWVDARHEPHAPAHSDGR